MMALTTKPSRNVSRGVDAVAEGLDDVAHHRVVAVGVRLVRDREDPARVGVDLLAEVAGRPLDERAERRRGDVLDDPPGVAVRLEAALEAALGRPRDVHRRDAVVGEADEHHGVVLDASSGRRGRASRPRRRRRGPARPCRTGSARASAPCEAMSSSAPPPASSASQKCGACGPLWPSRARNVVSRPIAPASIISRIRTVSPVKTTFSR